MSKDINQYIADFDTETQKRLHKLRDMFKKVLPAAEEGFKWGKPAFSMERVLIVYAGYKHHIGFYPTPEIIEEFSKELKEFRSASGSVQFPHSKPLPIALIKKMTKARLKKYLNEDAKWKLNKNKKTR